MRVDAHQHFWYYHPEKCSWMNEEMGILKKNYLPEELHGHLIQNNIQGCISVQADQSEEESLFLLKFAEQHPFIKGVVGWVDLLNPNIEERLNYFSGHPKFCGVRHIVQSEPEGFLLKKEFQKGMEALKKYELTYDLLIYPHQLGDVIKLCEKFPDNKMIVDHLAKPDIRNKKTDGWDLQMKKIASNRNVYCKLSGLVTEGNWNAWNFDDFKPYIDIVATTFGNDRLVFGSDWPVSLLAAEYSQTVNIVENYLAGSSHEIRSKIMGLNAIKFYNLNL